jgi:hypothetical protein
MSDWELVEESTPQRGKAASGQSFDWEIVPNAPSSQKAPQEGLGAALLKAPFRAGEDLYQGAAGFVKNIPGYFNQAQSEVPGAFNALRQHPLHALGQVGAGITEMGHNLLNSPRGIADYFSNRLNIIPQEYAQKVPYQEDISGAINQVFGEPQYSGEKLLRGTGRNAINLLGAKGVGTTLNPLNLTAKNIAKDVLRTEKQQVLEHGKRYNKIWNEAEKTGYNQVPVNQKLLSDNLSTIEKYKTPREYQSLEDFILEPTLQNAQKAQSDMGIIHRQLEKKSRRGSLTSEEQAIYKAAKDAEKHIENNMFKDGKGNVNNALQSEYQKLSKSYRQNVVPYKYNQAIQKYKADEILPRELVNSLSKGEFAAKKGGEHRAIGIRNNLGPISVGSALGVGLPWLYKQMFGDNNPEQ